jgi:micrococcal nuclease
MKALFALALLLSGCSIDSNVGLLGPSAELTPGPLATEAVIDTPRPSTDPKAADLPVKVTKHTATAAAGNTASVTIKTSKKAECGIVVQYDSGPSTAKGLGPKTADSTGVITWKWQVGRNTSSGKVPIDITCTLGDLTGTASTSFTVK